MSTIRALALLIILSACGCISTGQKPLPTNLGGTSAKIPDSTDAALPFTFSYPNNIADLNTLEEFFKTGGVSSVPSPLDPYFNPGTPLTGRAETYGHPYGGKARLFKRLPDFAGYKVLLFAYWDREADYKLPTLELQIFTADFRLTDKLIVADGTSFECSWERTVRISPDYEVQLTDRDVCYDVEADKKLSDTAYTTTFRLSRAGKLNPEGRSLNTGAASAGWNGKYSLVFPTGEEVTGISGDPVPYTIGIVVEISGTAARYTETHTRDVVLDYTCRIEQSADAITLYAEKSAGPGTTVPQKPLCTITRRGTKFHLKPLGGSRFSSIEPIPAEGVLLKRE